MSKKNIINAKAQSDRISDYLSLIEKHRNELLLNALDNDKDLDRLTNLADALFAVYQKS
jgi:hypothetical protein